MSCGWDTFIQSASVTELTTKHWGIVAGRHLHAFPLYSLNIILNRILNRTLGHI